jgi:hypothetical protein
MLNVRNSQLYDDDAPFFYLADTCWSALTNIALSDWEYYLNFRARQDFNVIQINLLKQWDASGDDLEIYPFAVQKHGTDYKFDFSKINIPYFDRTEQMLRSIRERNMVPALVLLWANYVPDTWASSLAHNNLFPYEHLDHYVSYVTKRFQKFHPIYFISGDTDFPTKRSIAYYRKVFDVAKANDPDALYSFHIKGRYSDLPREFLEKIDFFSYQSGHNPNGRSTAYTIPLNKRTEGFDKPIINTEPCYDQISYSRNQYGRFTPRDVRYAAWSSVLSGADAGISYGAHGIWSWHHTGASFGIAPGEGFDVPFDWHDAIHFRGADDLGWLKSIMCQVFPDGCVPIPQVLNHAESIRAATDREHRHYLIYLPTNTELDLSSLELNSQNSSAKVFDLQKRQTYRAIWRSSSVLALSPCLEDSLIQITRLEAL